MGLLDMGDDPLMGLATGLLSASGPSRMPVSLGQALGQGVQGMNEARQSGFQNQMMGLKMKSLKDQQAIAEQQAAYKQKFLQDPRIPDHIKQGVAAGIIDLSDLMKPQKVGAEETIVSPLQGMMGLDNVIAKGPAKAPKIGTEDVFTNGMWQKFPTSDGMPDLTKPIGSPFARGKDASTTDIRVNNAAETEQAKAWGKTLGEIRSGVATAAFGAPSKLAQLDRMEQLLTGVEGGKLAPIGMELASAASSIGLNIDPKLGNKEAAEALSREIAGSFRTPGTGPMTDKDFDNFLKRVPDLSKTAAGRKQIFTTMRSALKRDMETQKIVSNYAKGRNGNIDDNVLNVIAEHYAKNPVVSSSPSDVRAAADAIIGR